jgi:ribosome-dependent ATPase
VLAVVKPKELIEAKGAETLEAAFIAYMEDALAERPDEEMTNGGDGARALSGLGGGAAREGRAKGDGGMSPEGDGHKTLSAKRFWAYVMRETKELLRDPVRLGFAFIGSTILLFIFSYGITTDVDRVKFAVLDQDRTPQSRAYVEAFSGSRYFSEERQLSSIGDLEDRLRANETTVALQIPPRFGRVITRGGQPQVSVWIDGSNTMRAATIEGYVAGVHAGYLEQMSAASPLPNAGRVGVEITTRYLYNPTFESIYAIGPAVPAMLLILFPAILMAVSVVREKEIGTITNFYVTPSHRLEFLVGKQLPYIAITMVNFLLMAVIVNFVFQVPLKGSFIALALGALVYAAATTGYGLVIATFTSSQVAAVFATAILSLMPTFLFSGFLQPVSSLEGGARVIGTLWPTTYYMHMSVGAFTKGLSFAELAPDILALVCFVPVFLAIAAFFLRKQEK